MTDFTLIQRRQQLEQSYTQPTVKHPAQHRTRQQLQALWRKLVMVFAGGKDPHIWLATTPTGQTQYCAYDPVNRQRFNGDSEAALRAWLETRYYR